MKPRVTVTYCEGCEPAITVSAEDRELVEIRLVQEEDTSNLFFEHQGVRVWDVMREVGGRTPSSLWFSNRNGNSVGDDGTFDLLDIPKPPDGYDGPPLDRNHTPDADRRLMAYAIEQGWLTNDGLNLPD